METYNRYALRTGETLNNDIAKLPTAEKCAITGHTPLWNVPTDNFIGIVVNHKIISCVTPSYNLVQHAEAFRPVIEGFTQAGLGSFEYVLWNTDKKAQLQLYAGQTSKDTVKVGFKIENSVDGHSTLKYGLTIDTHNKYIELVGYRQVCSNGMTIRVPISEAEFVRQEEVHKIKNLMSEHTAIMHTKGATPKIEAMQYVAEAIGILLPSIDKMIDRAGEFKLEDQAQLKELIKLHVGKRFKSKVLDAYANENNDLWGLYNAMTWVASHDRDLTDKARETLLGKAGDMLRLEVSRPQVA